MVSSIGIFSCSGRALFVKGGGVDDTLVGPLGHYVGTSNHAFVCLFVVAAFSDILYNDLQLHLHCHDYFVVPTFAM